MTQEIEERLFIGYYRVSKDEQGKSGLGLSAQRQSVRNYTDNAGILLEEYEDVYTGKTLDREGLFDAIEACKRYGATLVVKEESRLSREGWGILMMLDKENVDYITAEAPEDTVFVKEIKLTVAKEERRRISERTKSALEQIKKEIANKGFYTTKKGKVIYTLGNSENLGKKAVKLSVETRKKKALNNENNLIAIKWIKKGLKDGKSYYAILKEMQSYGLKTSAGKNFTSTNQIKRLYELFN